MNRTILAMLAALAVWLSASMAWGQSATADGDANPEHLRLATVTRPPFSFVENGIDTGFSMDLWHALMADVGAETEVVRTSTFPEMLDLVRRNEVDAAVANISVTADRETEMDFSQPIFEAGLRVMVPASEQGSGSIWSVLISRDFLLASAGAFGLLLLVGMLMWFFERRHQPYFDKPAHRAMFPAFWWALNLVVNGGFEERQPQSWPGRLLGVALVISSLFVVSFFVANITAAMTVAAINSSVNSVNDLYGKRVGTTEGSTAAAFLTRRDMRFAGYPDLDSLLAAFEADELDAVVFDDPVLSYYANTAGHGKAELVGPVFLKENYAIAVPTGSPLAEAINQSLLRLRENGTYESIRQKWFGPVNG